MKRRILILSTAFFLFLGNHKAEAQTWEDFAARFDIVIPDSMLLDPADSLDIAETTFRYLFEHNTAVKRYKSKFYIIAWLHVARHRYIDPYAPFIARFYDVKPKVKKISFYYDHKKKLENKVVFFFITGIKMITPHTVQVDCGFYQSDDACAGHRYVLSYDRGVWELKSSVLIWEL